jgi:hypothetical protein
MLSFSDFKVSNISVPLNELATNRGGAPAKDVYHARVIDFSNGKALLNIDGRTVTADSEVKLRTGSEYDMIVKSYDEGGRAQLQIVGTQETESSAIRPLSDSMISTRLIGFDIPDSQIAIDSARTLVQMGVQVTKSNMQAMLNALPPTAPRQMVQFAASLIREELPLSRELMQLFGSMTRDIEQIPENLRLVSEIAASVASADKTATAQTQSQTGVVSTVELGVLSAPAGDDPVELIQKLPNFINAFMHSTESRLQAMVDLGLMQSGGADSRSSFIDQLILVLKILPGPAPTDANTLQNTLQPMIQLDTNIIDRAVKSIMQELNGIVFVGQDSEKFEQLRVSLNETLTSTAYMENQADRFISIRTAIAGTLGQAVELQSAPPDLSSLSHPSLFDTALQAMPNKLQNIMIQIGEMLDQMQNMPASGNSTAATREQILSILSQLISLNQFQFEGETSGQIKEFIEATTQWAKQSLKIASEGSDLNLPLRIAADAGITAASERIRTALENPALREQVQLLFKNFSDLPDLRLALARAAQSQDIPMQTAARGLAQGLQSAGLANITQHSGVAPMNSYIAFFPIQIGGRVEIGQLKVYQREEERRDRSKGLKPLNPFDAHIALILDTEFLGLTAINLRTYPNKAIKCDIEVQDARRRKIVDSHLDELRDSLSNTAYEQNTVSVAVRRRKSADSKDEEPPVANVVAVDMRI